MTIDLVDARKRDIYFCSASMPIRAIAYGTSKANRAYHVTSSVGLRFELSVTDEFSC